MFIIHEIHFTFPPRTAPPPPELRLRLLFRPLRLPPSQHLLPGLPLGLLQAQGRGGGEEAGEAHIPTEVFVVLETLVYENGHKR